MTATPAGSPRGQLPGPVSHLLRSAAAGLLLGAVWGVFLRAWMRLLVAYGEFSWSGTLLIIGCSAAAGAGLALVRTARRSGRRRRWRWAALLAAPLVLFPQGVVVLLPALLLGGLVISGRPPARWRVLLTAVASAPLIVLAVTFEAEPLAMPLPIVLVVLATLLVALASAGADLFRRWPSPAPDGSAALPLSIDQTDPAMVGLPMVPTAPPRSAPEPLVFEVRRDRRRTS